MRKVAGRLKLELSQYRELEAFSQFGSELDPETQRTLARGERLVKTLNQPERHPMPVEDQVVQVYAATNGYLDRIVGRQGRRVPGRAHRVGARQRRRPAGEDRRRRLERRDPEGRRRGGRQGVRRGLRLRPRRGGPPARRRATCRDARPSDATDGDERRREEQAQAAEEPRPAPSGCRTMAQTDVQATASARSRTSRRSRARWRWSPRRACAGPSSASRRCAPTRTRSGG